MRRPRGRQRASHRIQNRYQDEQRRFGGNHAGQEQWREPSQQSRYIERGDYEPEYDQPSRFGRDQESWRGMRSQGWSPEGSRTFGWGNVGRADWEQGWNREHEYEPRYEREEYGYDPQDRLGAITGYEPRDYSYSGRSERDWSGRMRGSYGQGLQQEMYGQSSLDEPWREGSYQGPNRGVTRGAFGRTRFQSLQGRLQGTFAGRGPQGYKRSDERIKEDVNETLTQDPDIDPTNIQVEVQNGEVTLKGTVSDREAKRRAEDIADSCPGVREVQNQLRVRREEEFESETSRRDRSEEKQKSHRQMAS